MKKIAMGLQTLNNLLIEAAKTKLWGPFTHFAGLTNKLYQKRWVRLLLFGTIILAVFFSLLFSLYANWQVLVNYKWQINYGALELTFVFYSLNLLAIIYGWHLIMGGLANNWKFSEHFRIYVLTELAKRLPGSLIHVAGRLIMYERMNTRKSLVVLGSGLEAILMVVSAAIVYLLASSFNREKYGEGWLIGAVILGLILMHPTVINLILTKIKNVNHTQPLKYRQILLWLLFYALGWSLGGVTVFWLINTLTPLPFNQLPQVIAAWTLAGSLSSLIFFSPSGLGIQEITLTVLIGQLIPEPIAIIVAILLRILLTLYQIIWVGLVLLFSKVPFSPKTGLIPPKDY